MYTIRYIARGGEKIVIGFDLLQVDPEATRQKVNRLYEETHAQSSVHGDCGVPGSAISDRSAVSMVRSHCWLPWAQGAVGVLVFMVLGMRHWLCPPVPRTGCSGSVLDQEMTDRQQVRNGMKRWETTGVDEEMMDRKGFGWVSIARK